MVEVLKLTNFIKFSFGRKPMEGEGISDFNELTCHVGIEMNTFRGNGFHFDVANEIHSDHRSVVACCIDDAVVPSI